MPYRAIAPRSDDRRQKQATAPIVLNNCVVRETPADDPKAARAPYFIAPTPGRTLRATMGDNVRGLFSEPGCRNGNLFIPNGSEISEMTSSLSSTSIGAISGGDVVQMRADRADLATLAFGIMRKWDGTTFTTINDVDAPTFATSLAVAARRWVAANQTTDLFNWAVAGDPTDWRANNQAQDQDMPDPIVGQEEIGGDLWSLNSRSTQIWRPTGGAEETAFGLLPGINIKVGMAGRDAFAKMGAGGMLLGHTRQVYGTRGYDLEPVPNLALEQALKALTATALSECVASSYQDGGKEFWQLSAGLENGHVFDSELGLWHTRSRYGMSEYDVDFAVSAFGRVFVAGRNSPKVWSLDDDVYTDESDPIQRDMTLSIASAGDVPVSRIVFDIRTRDVPASGQGSSPTMMLRSSRDGGETWDTWRQGIALPTPSNRFRVQEFGFGLAGSEDGLLIQIRITDPIGYALWGCWINPSPDELNGAGA